MQVKIQNCLVAEDVRPEADGRATIIGYMGMAPFPKIDAPNAAEAPTRISFMWVIEGLGNVALSCAIRSAGSKATIYSTQNLEALLVSDQLLNAIFGPLDIKFPGHGLYETVLLVNGEESASYPFRLV